MLRKILLIKLLLLPTLLIGQARLKGSFISTHYIRWVYNRRTKKDDQYNGLKGTPLIIRFSEDKIDVMPAKGFNQQNYLIISVTFTERNIDSSLRVKEFTYNLKDKYGRPVLLLASVEDKGRDFKFDFFKGYTERTTYTNCSGL